MNSEYMYLPQVLDPVLAVVNPDKHVSHAWSPVLFLNFPMSHGLQFCVEGSRVAPDSHTDMERQMSYKHMNDLK